MQHSSKGALKTPRIFNRIFLAEVLQRTHKAGHNRHPDKPRATPEGAAVVSLGLHTGTLAVPNI